MSDQATRATRILFNLFSKETRNAVFYISTFTGPVYVKFSGKLVQDLVQFPGKFYKKRFGRS